MNTIPLAEDCLESDLLELRLPQKQEQVRTLEHIQEVEDVADSTTANSTVANFDTGNITREVVNTSIGGKVKAIITRVTPTIQVSLYTITIITTV